MNPSGVAGGMGFVSSSLGGGTLTRDATPGNAGNPAATASGDTYDYNSANAKGTCARRLGLAADATGRYMGAIADGSGTTAVQDKLQADGVCMVYTQYSGGPTVYLDVTNGAWPSRDGGTAGKVNVSSNGTETYGMRTTRVALTKTQANRCAGRGAAAGNPAYIDGYIFFLGDHASGVRVHTLTHKGTRVYDHWPEEAWKASVDAFCRRDSSLASNARVAILSWITNDCNNNPTETTSHFITAYTAAIDRCLAQGINKVILVIPPEPNSSAISVALSVWRSFRDAIYTIQASRADDVAIIDMGYFIEYAAYDATNSLRGGLLAADGLHLSVGGHALLGHILADYIAWGFGY